jgi:hypothetical protein
MKLHMQDEEIRRDYQRAKDKKKQVEILADMNLVTVTQMREKLAELGVLEQETAPADREAEKKRGRKPEPKSGDQAPSAEGKTALTAAELAKLLNALDLLYSGVGVTVNGMRISGVLAKMRFDWTSADTPTDMTLELEVSCEP